MQHSHIEKILLAACVSLLFGCGGESDEAKNLGFSSVDEMKVAQAKGWHTQQKYYEDNPNIASESVEKKLRVEKTAAEAKAAENKKTEVKSAVEEKTDVTSGGLFRQGIDYRNYGAVNECTVREKVVCLTAAEYKQACQLAKGVTGGGLNVYTEFASAEEKAILKGGDVDSISVSWSDDRNRCGVYISASGIYNGTSTKINGGGRASEFKMNSEGKFLVSFIDQMR